MVMVRVRVRVRVSLAMVVALEGPPPTGGREYSVYSAASFLRSSYRAL